VLETNLRVGDVVFLDDPRTQPPAMSMSILRQRQSSRSVRIFATWRAWNSRSQRLKRTSTRARFSKPRQRKVWR